MFSHLCADVIFVLIMKKNLFVSLHKMSPCDIFGYKPRKCQSSAILTCRCLELAMVRLLRHVLLSAEIGDVHSQHELLLAGASPAAARGVLLLGVHGSAAHPVPSALRAAGPERMPRKEADQQIQK